ncbi:MAG: hypothetical protein ACKOTB_14205 [Planctomycetia bacterium]
MMSAHADPEPLPRPAGDRLTSGRAIAEATVPALSWRHGDG